MEEEELNKQLLDVGTPGTDELPSVPTAEPSRPEPRVGKCIAGVHGIHVTVICTVHPQLL